MATFQFRMTTLLRVREGVRDECRLQLTEAQRAEDIILARISEIDEELGGLRVHTQRVSGPGPVNVDRLLDAGRFEMILKAERFAAEEQLKTVAAEVDRRRQLLVEADREVKVLVKLREQQTARHRFEEGKRETKRLDATALQLTGSKEHD
jgi:flagellar FliJ protein